MSETKECQYIYIAKDDEGCYKYKGTKSKRLLKKHLERQEIYGVFPTLSADADKSQLPMRGELSHLRESAINFYKKKYANFAVVLGESNMYDSYLES